MAVIQGDFKQVHGKVAIVVSRFNELVTKRLATGADETDHYAMIISNVTSVVMELNLAGKVPVTFGMLTIENIDQALQRSGLKVGNEGSATAQSLLEMMSLQEKIG